MNREQLERLGVEEVNTVLGSRFEGEAAIVHALLALRYAVLALAADPEPEVSEPRWCRVELFGHTIVYGCVTEVRVAGRRFLEVVEPTLYAEEGSGEEGIPERRRQFNPSAVYALEELGEDATVKALAEQHRGIPF